MKPHDILAKHEGKDMLFDMVMNHQYLPQTSSHMVVEVFAAMKEINPSFTVDGGCSGCVINAIKQCYYELQRYKKTI